MISGRLPSTMTRFRLWWESLDAVLAAFGQKPLSYEEARLLHDCELEPNDVAACLERARDPSDEEMAWARASAKKLGLP